MINNENDNKYNNEIIIMMNEYTNNEYTNNSSNNKNNKNNTNNNSTTNKCIKRPRTMIIIMIINDTAKAKYNKMIIKFDNKIM